MMLLYLLFMGLCVLCAPLLFVCVRGLRQANVLFGVLFGFLCALAFITYEWLGASPALTAYWKSEEQKVAIKQFMSEVKSVDQIIERLKKRIDEDPQKAQGWFLLGRLYFSTQQFENATQAFFKAHHLKPKDVVLTAHLAQSMYLSNHQSIDKTVRRLIDEVMAVKPEDPMMLNLLATDAYTHKRFKQAIQYWERLLPQLPDGSDDKKLVVEMMAKAQLTAQGVK